MKRIYFLFLFFSIQITSCKAQDFQVSSLVTDELRWKKTWVDIFFKEYRKYQEINLSNCHDKDRNIRFDIERKIRAINQFTYSITLSELRLYLDRNSIEYDSLIMYNSHSWYYEEELNFAPVSFYLYSKVGIKKLMAYYDADQIPTIKEIMENVDIFYEYVQKVQNGCGYGFDTITYFDKGLSNWEIRRILINPDE